MHGFLIFWAFDFHWSVGLFLCQYHIVLITVVLVFQDCFGGEEIRSNDQASNDAPSREAFDGVNYGGVIFIDWG